MYNLNICLRNVTKGETLFVAENAEFAFKSGGIQSRRMVYQQISDLASDYVVGMGIKVYEALIWEALKRAGCNINVSDFLMRPEKRMDSSKAHLQEIQSSLYPSVMSQCGGHLLEANLHAYEFKGHIADYISPEKFSVDEVADYEVHRALIARWEVDYGPRRGRPRCKLMDYFDEERFASVAKEIYRQKYGCDIVEDNLMNGKKGVERSNCYLIAFASASVGGVKVISKLDAVKCVHSFVRKVFPSLRNIWSLGYWQSFFARFKDVEIASANHFRQNLVPGIVALAEELAGIFLKRGYKFCTSEGYTFCTFK